MTESDASTTERGANMPSKVGENQAEAASCRFISTPINGFVMAPVAERVLREAALREARP